MTLVKWKPFVPVFSDFPSVQSMLEEAEKMFDDVFSVLPSVTRQTLSQSWAPAFDWIETDDAYILYMDVPGMKKKDVEIRVDRGFLTISGTRELPENDEKVTYLCQERWSGQFQRTISLPDSVDVDHIKAEMKNGVLKVVLPKRAEAKPRNISIQ